MTQETGGLAGKVAIVTGGASGIGRAICERFASEGAAVVVADVNSADGAEVADSLSGIGAFVSVDVSGNDDCRRMVETAISRFNRLDILVNNAGIGGLGAISEMDEEMWDTVIAVNLKGVFLGTKHAFPVLAKSGGGVILNMASVGGITAAPGFAAYGASKAGVIHLTKVTAMEGAPYGIRANAICPVWTDTPMAEAFLQTRPNPKAARAMMEEAIPLGRFGTPADVAEAALYLVSDAASFITGIAFPVDGGLLAGSAAKRR